MDEFYVRDCYSEDYKSIPDKLERTIVDRITVTGIPAITSQPRRMVVIDAFYYSTSPPLLFPFKIIMDEFLPVNDGTGVKTKKVGNCMVRV
ncbi:hypothetical protein L916_02295 [Phytophthora nicotianae]|uniref:Uncharacterized protein n=1 Tax=Phytophthora nicotianae TaxID=4792 RepID=W2JQK3_PHYNI|nr:hypothetical protein L916_02295 [Phytophthora nicotianae]